MSTNGLSESADLGLPKPGGLNSTGPAFIVSAARSGSTLLRYFIDAHPDFGCPTETNIAGALDAVQFAAAASRLEGDDSEWQVDADALCRRLADEIYRPYLERNGKSRWCDKSLITVERTEMLARIFPDARFICLYRQCLDMVASGLEACPHGLGAYGFDAYARETPGNAIWSLGRYWADRAEAAIAFEEACSGATLRVRYEDFVNDAAGELARIFDFLGAPWPDVALSSEEVFNRPTVTGPQDYKIVYSHGVDNTSVGRGWTVPLDLFPPPLIERINVLHERLGYEPLEAAVRGLAGAAANENPRAERRIDSVESLIRERIRPRLSAGDIDSPEIGAASATLLLADGHRGWHIDLSQRTVSEGAASSTALIVSDERTVLAIANGDENPAVALRRGLLRVQPTSDGEDATSVGRLGDAVVALLKP